METFTHNDACSIQISTDTQAIATRSTRKFLNFAAFYFNLFICLFLRKKSYFAFVAIGFHFQLWLS